MALSIDLHKTAYLLRRKGLSFDDILDHLKESLEEDQVPSKSVLHRWASSESSCQCIWHNWPLLLEIDTSEAHTKAFALVTANHDNLTIASALEVPLELVEAWAEKDFPCFCGCHGWSKPAQAIVPLEIPQPITILSTNPTDAQEQAMLTVIESVRDAVAKGTVVPRSWKDVLDTVKTINDILSKPSSPRGSTKGIKVSETQTRSVTLPPPVERANKELTVELLQAVGIDPGILREE